MNSTDRLKLFGIKTHQSPSASYSIQLWYPHIPIPNAIYKLNSNSDGHHTECESVSV